MGCGWKLPIAGCHMWWDTVTCLSLCSRIVFGSYGRGRVSVPQHATDCNVIRSTHTLFLLPVTITVFKKKKHSFSWGSNPSLLCGSLTYSTHPTYLYLNRPVALSSILCCRPHTYLVLGVWCGWPTWSITDMCSQGQEWTSMLKLYFVLFISCSHKDVPT